MRKFFLVFTFLISPGIYLLADESSLKLHAPVDFQVVQRGDGETGMVRVFGELGEPTTEGVTVEVRIEGRDWRKVALVEGGESTFDTKTAVPVGGWYRFDVRTRIGGQVQGQEAVGHLGVGEVFVIAGQSNSANHGEERQRIESGEVATFDGEKWMIAHDPQPGASGNGGSFAPAFGDEMVKRFGVPVGIISTGVGATSVREWLPKGATFPNPPTILNKVSKLPDGNWESRGGVFENFLSRARKPGAHGFRAVLWHQGESDANQKDSSRTLPGKLYQKYLTQLIEESRESLGWRAPWFVAQASYQSPGDPGSPDIRAAQRGVWESGIACQGPDSDALDGVNRDSGGKGVHFSSAGLNAHGLAWAAMVSPWLEDQLKKKRTKVFVLAGQSNMEGQGVVSMDHEEYYNGGRGNLVWSMEHSGSRDKMKHLRNEAGEWMVRDDVEISFKAKGGIRRGPLTIGFTGYGGSSHIGPELQFGHVIGDHFEEPVFLIKTAWGGKSLHKDFRPPSSGGETGEFYRKMLEEIEDALAGFPPDSYEIAGFVWMQGWNDMVSKEATAEYETNLVNLAGDLRKDLELPGLPFVIGELGNMGPASEGSGMEVFRSTQKRGAGKIAGAEFVLTGAFARPKEESPNIGHGHHWFGNAESYFLIGDALARRMIEMLKD